MDIKISLCSDTEKKNPPVFNNELGFGKYFSDHMFQMRYDNQSWHSAEILPYHSFTLSPSSMVFHYGQAIFEGMKAYKNQDKIMLFRPYENMERMCKSAWRLAMPEFDKDFVLNAIEKLIQIDRNWIPENEGSALYIRPTMIATEPFLGVRPSSSYLFFIITGPVGPYYKNGFNPVSIYVTRDYVRAVPGGMGTAKAAGNYAGSLRAQLDGAKQNCSQVLWLDGVERRYIEEVGAMNLFIKFKDELATPALSGSILPGVTRKSVLTITKSLGLNVVERKIALDEVLEGIENGDVTEIFGAGTAAVISPVGKLVCDEKEYIVNTGKIGDLSLNLFNTLTQTQRGQIQDEFGFCHTLENK